MKDLYGVPISKERMDAYFAELKAYEQMMYAKEPKKETFGFDGKMWPDFESEKAFSNAYSEWHMSFHCNAPNEPGYYRANND
jgi:hypothetical protein